MAIIKHLHIKEFKIFSFTATPGFQDESTAIGNNNQVLSGWTLDQKPQSGIFTGTEDFDGVVKKSILLAYLEEITLDIGPMTVNQFVQLPPNPHIAPNAFQQPQLAMYNLEREDIGWVKIADSLTSFYYEDCSKIEGDGIGIRTYIPGRLPVSRNYFNKDTLDIEQIQNQNININVGPFAPMMGGFSIPIISGEGFTPYEVQRIVQYYTPYANLNPGDLWRVGPNPLHYPGLPELSFSEYLNIIVTNDGIARIVDKNTGVTNELDGVVTIKADIRPLELQKNNRFNIETPDSVGYEGLDSDSTTRLVEVGVNNFWPRTITFDDGRKTRFIAEPRGVIENAFAAAIVPIQGNTVEEINWETTDSNRDEGDCILFFDRAQVMDPNLGPGGPTIGDDSLTEYPEYGDVTGPYSEFPPKDFLNDNCGGISDILENSIPLDVITYEDQQKNILTFIDDIYLTPNKKIDKITQKTVGVTLNPNEPVREDTYVFEDNQRALRMYHRFRERSSGIIDPREISLENKSIYPGILHKLYNRKTCTYDIIPALRDKDGDIPEPIGPILTYHMENVRRSLKNSFNISDSDPILKTLATGSDGYTYFSDGKSYKELIGETALGCGELFSFDKIPEIFVEMYPKNESKFVKTYRKKIERPSKVSTWILPDPYYHHDDAYLMDLVIDYANGIPDVDMVTDPFFSDSAWSWVLRPMHQSTLVPSIFRKKREEKSEFFRQLYSNPMWYRYVPSRWKAMMRPIYHDIWEDNLINYDKNYSESNPPVMRQDEKVGYTSLYDITDDSPNAKYEFTNLPYFTRTTLGDYGLYRNKLGYPKLVYDKIDEAISIRSNLDDDDTAYVWELFSPVDEYFSTLFENWMLHGILFAGENILHGLLHSVIAPVYNWVFNTLTTELGMNAGKFVASEVIGGFNAATGVHLLGSDESTWDPTALVMDLIELTVTYAYSLFDYEYNERKPLDRTTFGLLRSFKPGGVVLRSRSKFYTHTKEPCPIIFLGFNDKKYISRGTYLKNEILQSLSKDDQIDTIYFKQNRQYYQDKQVSVDGKIDNRPVHSMPIMKKRIKKYGINPLLDVFYLNIAEKSQEHVARLPFRPGYDGVINQKKEWPDLNRSQYPSIFPPLWNEGFDNGLSSLKDIGLKGGASYGDIAWSAREKNTIISLKDRWTLSLEQTGNTHTAVLTDKTPILDIYSILMEMHVKGISWKEILNYVNETKRAVSGPRFKEQINLSMLESILNRLQSRLNEINVNTNVDSEEFSPIVLPTTNWGYVEFGTTSDLTKEVVFLNTTGKPVRVDSISIQATIEDDIPYGIEMDTYENDSHTLFKLIDGNVNPKYISPGVVLSGPPIQHKIGVMFKNNTENHSVEPLFPYIAVLKIKGTIEPDVLDEQFEVTTPLIAKVSTQRQINLTDAMCYKYPLNLPDVIKFDQLMNGEEFEKDIVFLNSSDSDEIELGDGSVGISSRYGTLWEIVNEGVSVLDKTTGYHTTYKTPLKPLVFNITDFWKYDINSNTKISISNGEKIIPNLLGNPQIYGMTIKFSPSTLQELQSSNDEKLNKVTSDSLLFYKTNIIFKYKHRNYVPSNNKTNATLKTINIEIMGASSLK